MRGECYAVSPEAIRSGIEHFGKVLILRKSPDFSLELIMPSWPKRFFYRTVVTGIRGYAAAAWDLKVDGRERVPSGPKLYVANHVSSVDPYWAMLALPDFLHFVVGPPYALRAFSPVLDFLEQINAMPKNRREVVDRSCHWLARGGAVYIAPEGDLHRPFEPGHFYTGLAKIYRKSRTPIIPVSMAVAPERMRRHPKWDLRVEGRNYEAWIVWRGKIRVSIGHAMMPHIQHDVDEEVDNRRITELVRAVIAARLQELRSEF